MELAVSGVSLRYNLSDGEAMQLRKEAEAVGASLVPEMHGMDWVSRDLAAEDLRPASPPWSAHRGRLVARALPPGRWVEVVDVTLDRWVVPVVYGYALFSPEPRIDALRLSISAVRTQEEIDLSVLAALQLERPLPSRVGHFSRPVAWPPMSRIVVEAASERGTDEEEFNLIGVLCDPYGRTIAPNTGWRRRKK